MTDQELKNLMAHTATINAQTAKLLKQHAIDNKKLLAEQEVADKKRLATVAGKLNSYEGL